MKTKNVAIEMCKIGEKLFLKVLFRMDEKLSYKNKMFIDLRRKFNSITIPNVNILVDKFYDEFK